MSSHSRSETDFSPSPRLAATRFGYGLVPGEAGRLGPDWLASQLEETELPDRLNRLPHSALLLGRNFKALQEGRAAYNRYLLASLRAARTEWAEHSLAAYESPHPFRERLVDFWMSFFGLSAVTDARVMPLVAAFEREAIRPFATGNYSALLVAACQHPAMLTYENNSFSAGPSSEKGLDGKLKLNRQLARTILNRFTLGPSDSARRKEDEDVLARILSGWTIAGPGRADAGRFLFREDMHDPGEKVFQGRRYPDSGILQGEAAFDALARKAATARQLAFRLARHFVNDLPDEQLTGAMAAAYLKSRGDLSAMILAMLEHPLAWPPAQAKIKTPREFVFSAYRAQGVDFADGEILLHDQEILGQPPYRAPGRDGWPDDGQAWFGPGAAEARINWAGAAAHAGRGNAGEAFATAVLSRPPAEDLLRWLQLSASGAEARALVFSSPQFQRR